MSNVVSLAVVSAPRDAWNQNLKESASDYSAFISWCVTPDRPVPPDRRLAALHNWAERARLWDTRFNYRPNDAIAETLDNLKATIVNESRKFVRDSGLQDARTMTVGELAKLMIVIQGVAQLPIDDDFDASDLSHEDLQSMLTVLDKCASVKRK